MKYFVTSKISDNIRKTPEGYLVCIGVPIGRTGVQEYGEDETPIDPDENGVELYWDRPHDQWPKTSDGGIQMYTRRLDLEGLLKEGT